MGRLDHGTMCTLCQTLPLSKPHTPGHVHMHPVTRLEDFGEEGAQSLYRCSVCHTHWLYQKDKWQSCLGFKLWTGDLTEYRSSGRKPYKSPDPAETQRIIRGPTHQKPLQ